MLSNSITTKDSPFFHPAIPDIVPYFYGPRNIPEIIDNYLDDFSYNNNEVFLEFKKFLLDYNDYLYYESRSSNIDIVNELYDFILAKYPDLLFEIFSRRKSFCKAIAKSVLVGGQIKDTRGARIVAYSTSNEICYDLMNNILDFFVNSKHYVLLPSEITIDTSGFDANLFPDVDVPRESLVRPEFKFAVKDYVIEPKSDTAYQSLHAVISDPFTKQLFELQIRNIVMHERAICGTAFHSDYKEARYGKSLDFSKFVDYKKIYLNGFFFKEIKDGKEKKVEIIQDSQGFVNSFILFDQSKLF